MFTIMRDGKAESTPLEREIDVLAWFHKNTSGSMHNALTHQGYTVLQGGEDVTRRFRGART